jgi:hypothetical protein
MPNILTQDYLYATTNREAFMAQQQVDYFGLVKLYMTKWLYLLLTGIGS